MKNLDKMTKEELKELIKELEEGKVEDTEENTEEKSDLVNEMYKAYKEYKMKNNKDFEEDKDKIRKGFEELLEDSFCMIVSSNKGNIISGTKTDIMSCISSIITKMLVENYMTEFDLNSMFTAIKRVYKSNKEGKSVKSELEDLLDEIFN